MFLQHRLDIEFPPVVLGQELARRIGEFFPDGIAGNAYLKALRFATGFRLSRGRILRQAALVEACRPFVNDSTAVRRLREGDDVMYSAVQYTTIAGIAIPWRPQ